MKMSRGSQVETLGSKFQFEVVRRDLAVRRHAAFDAVGEADQFGPRVGVHLPHHAGAAKLDRPQAQVELQGDGFVGLAGHGQFEHLSLVGGQRFVAFEQSTGFSGLLVALLGIAIESPGERCPSGPSPGTAFPESRRRRLLIAATAAGMSPWPLIMITGVLIWRALQLVDDFQSVELRHPQVEHDAAGLVGVVMIEELATRGVASTSRFIDWISAASDSRTCSSSSTTETTGVLFILCLRTTAT